jgi:lipid II:glycine glycyltransferase (peptidoglycan interpeptide bridge formation enzyme)
MAKTFFGLTIASTGFECGSETRAVIPFIVEEKKQFLKTERKYKSMDPGVYGGIIADRELVQEDVDGIFASVLKLKSAGGRIVGNPFKPFSFPSQFKKKELYTQIIDLTSGFDAVRKRFSRGQKSNISQAQRKNIHIRWAETEQDIKHYCDIYMQTLKRWGGRTITRYPEQLFLNLFAQQDHHIRFLLAEKETKIIAGIIILAWQKKLLYWHGCSREEFFTDYPNNLLHYSALQWGCEQGFTHYDMGPSMDMEGVVRFKQSFGAENVWFSSYRWK